MKEVKVTESVDEPVLHFPLLSFLSSTVKESLSEEGLEDIYSSKSICIHNIYIAAVYLKLHYMYHFV